MTNRQKIIHVDMDCFYAAVEIHDHPFLAGKPVGVGGVKNGVLATCNYEARRYGLRSAMPTFKAKNLCPDLILLPSRMDRYRQVSKQIQGIFHRYTDCVEPLSLDEAYLDVGENTHFHGSATLIAQAIRQDIYRETGLTASAGIAPLKFLAKIASGLKKPNQQFTISPESMMTFIEALPLKSIPGVGRATGERLTKLGLNTCLDLKNFDYTQLIRLFGRHGEHLWNYSHGLDERPVIAHRPRKSVGAEKTFVPAITTLETAETLLPVLYERLLTRLPDSFSEKQKRQVQRISVKIKLDNFKLLRIERLQAGIELQFFRELLRKLWLKNKVKRIRLLGIQTRLPTTGHEHQYSLWQEEEGLFTQ